MTEFLNFELIIQSILIIIIIIQTSYIGNTMRLNRRINQYQLTHEWNQKLRDVYNNHSVPDINDPQIYENEYRNLIYVFQDMHNLFRDKLLKSSDFVTMFMRLYLLTNIEADNKSEIFHKNHIILATIYHDFNNIEVGMKLFDYVDNEVLETITKKEKKNSFTYVGIEQMKKNYPKSQKWLKFGLWIMLKIQKKIFFELPSLK